jgi:hypothetical protein
VQPLSDQIEILVGTIHGPFGALYPVYVRGEAYLAARRGAEAVAEFQKILDHRGIVISDPVGAVTRLEMGQGLYAFGRQEPSQPSLSGFSYSLEGRGSQRPDPEAGSGRILAPQMTYFVITGNRANES